MEISTRCEKKFPPEPPFHSPLSVSPEYSGSAHFFNYWAPVFHTHLSDKYKNKQMYTDDKPCYSTNPNQTGVKTPLQVCARVLWSVCCCQWFIFTGSCLSCWAVPWSVPGWDSGSSSCCDMESPHHRRSRWPLAPLTWKWKKENWF